MPGVLVFDVNETMLDLRALDPHFERVFGDAAVRRQWFQQFVQNFLVTVVLSSYVDFGTIGRSALDMVAERLGKTSATTTASGSSALCANSRPTPTYGKASSG